MNSFDFRLHVLRNWYLHERLFYEPRSIITGKRNTENSLGTTNQI